MRRAIPPFAGGAGRCTSPTRRRRASAVPPFIDGERGGGPRLHADFNGAEQEGVGLYQFTTKGGRRMSAARAFLRPAMKRKNLQVETHAQVTRLLFEGRRAMGVDYVQHGADAGRRRRGAR